MGFFHVAKVLVVLLAGCSSNPLSGPPPTIAPAEPAVAPPTAVAPAGTVRPLREHCLATVFDPATVSLVVLSPGPQPSDPATVSVLAASGDGPRAIRLPGPASALAGDGHGTAYLSATGGYFRVDLATGTPTRVDVNGQNATDFTAVARRADGKLVLGSADGTVYTLGSDADVAARVGGFARVDALVTQGDTAVVLDRGQTSVTTIDASGDRTQQALRAGEGATTMAADSRGRVLVADTRGGQLLVFGTDPLILRQAFPVADAPYGLVGTAGLTWVSQTAANSVIGYDLATGIPVEKVRYPTVRQPNSLAFDDATDTLYVVSATGDGVQAIEHAGRPR